MKRLEYMSVEELLVEVIKTHREVGFKPKKFKVDEQGTILLDLNDSDDKDWIEADLTKNVWPGYV